MTQEKYSEVGFPANLAGGERAGKTQNLKLVTQYDARWSEFTVFHHNLTPEAADQAVRELSARLFSFFVVDQRERHLAEDADDCEACRRDVDERKTYNPNTD